MLLDPSLRPSPVTVAMSDTSCSHAVKITLWSKEKTDNAQTDKTEQVTLGIKQRLSFKTLSFLRNSTINTVLWLFNVS